MPENKKLQELKAGWVKNILSLPDYDEKGYPNILKMELARRVKLKARKKKFPSPDMMINLTQKDEI